MNYIFKILSRTNMLPETTFNVNDLRKLSIQNCLYRYEKNTHIIVKKTAFFVSLCE